MQSGISNKLVCHFVDNPGMRLIIHIRDLLLLILAAVYLLSWNINPSFSIDSEIHAHKAVDCASCHPLIASIDNDNIPFVLIDKECRSCHESNNVVKSSFGLGFHSDSERSCRECHSFHNPGNFVAGNKIFQVDEMTENLAAICKSCHNENSKLYNLSDAHRAAANLYHSDTRYLKHLSPSEACMACHSKSKLTGIKAFTEFEESQFESPPIIFEHSSHPFGVEFDMNSVEFRVNSEQLQKLEQLNLPNGKIECQTCHQISEKSDTINGDEMQICQTCHPEK